MVGRCIRKRRSIRSTEAYTATLMGFAARCDPEESLCGKSPRVAVNFEVNAAAIIVTITVLLKTLI